MRDRSFLLRYRLHHVLFWMLVFILWFYLRYQDYISKQTAIEVTLLKVIDLAAMIYFTNYWLVPRLLYRKKYMAAVVTFASMIFISAIIKVYGMSRITDHPEIFSFAGNLKTRLYENVISDFFLVTAGASFKLIFDYLRMQQRMVQIAKEKAETELSFLKSQINPHFIFNSLNSVYFLIDKENSGARQALHKFSEMLRYQLYEVNDARIPIEKELGYLKDYVDLQKMRKDENYSIEFNCSSEVKGFSIEPLLLIPFVENAFKHISHKADEKNFVKLDMTRQNGQFSFSIENSKDEVPTTGRQGGIGLNNVRRRLELLYPERHELKIDSGEVVYKVELKLKIDQ